VEKRIIARGLVAGALGGVLAFLFARVFAEPVVGKAIDFEDMHNADGSAMHDHGAELFSRGVQGNIGIGFGVLAFAVAMGALFAVAFVVLYGRVGGVGARTLSILLAGFAFGSVYVVPFVKYPPNPPAVGRAQSIGERTGLYLLMVLGSVALAAAAVWLGRRLYGRLGVSSATLTAAGAYMVAITLLMLVLPPVAETPEHFPADVLYDFRLYSLGTQLVLWATIGLVFAPLAARLLGDRPGVSVTSQPAGA